MGLESDLENKVAFSGNFPKNRFLQIFPFLDEAIRLCYAYRDSVCREALSGALCSLCL